MTLHAKFSNFADMEIRAGRINRVFFELNVEPVDEPGISSDKQLQIFCLSSRRTLMSYSDYRKPTGDIFSGSIRLAVQSTNVYSCVVDLNNLPIDVDCIVFVLRIIGASAMPCTQASTFSYRVQFEDSLKRTSSPVPLATAVNLQQFDQLVDWFCVGLLKFGRDSSGAIDRLLFKDISSFPPRSGDLVFQLQELLESLSAEISLVTSGVACTGWFQIGISESQIFDDIVGESCTQCLTCEANEQRYQALLCKVAQLENMLRESQGIERRRELASALVDESLLDFPVPTDENRSGSLESQLKRQEDLIVSIKGQLLNACTRLASNGSIARTVP